MRQQLAILTFDTPGQGPMEITDTVNGWLRATELRMGVMTLFSQHNSAGLLVAENAAPEVESAMATWMKLAVPDGQHFEDNPDDPDGMSAHIRAMLTGNSLTLPVADGRMMLGKWQALFLYEHSASPRKRGVVAQFIGA